LHIGPFLGLERNFLIFYRLVAITELLDGRDAAKNLTVVISPISVSGTFPIEDDEAFDVAAFWAFLGIQVHFRMTPGLVTVYSPDLPACFDPAISPLLFFGSKPRLSNRNRETRCRSPHERKKNTWEPQRLQLKT
jgi:hypothetical protein